MITVIIPLYNKEKFIAQAVKSMLEQTYGNIELIVVNDGSTDRSLSIVSSIEDARLRIISIPNSGVSVARNTGIGAAKYEWIGFLDADDWWAPDFLEEMTKAIEEYPKNRLFATGRSRVFKQAIERYAHPLLPNDGETGLVNYFSVIRRFLPLINASNSLFHKSVFEEKGYFRHGQKKHEDHDLWLRLVVDEWVVFVNKNLSFYRKTEAESASTEIYQAEDFITYLETMQELKAQLTGVDLFNFQKHANRFVLLTYIKNYGHYTRQQENAVFYEASKVIEGKELFLLKALKMMPYKKTYPLFKLFK